MAIDHGSKRCGIAVTDTGKMIATGLTTVATGTIFEFLSSYFLKEKVECIVVGSPKGLDNKATDATHATEVFVKQLKKKFAEMKIERLDERFTSKMAFQTMIGSGLKKEQRKNKELVDEISATILLQGYLELIDTRNKKNGH